MAAVWADGTVLRGDSPDTLAKPYRRGKPNAAQMGHLLRLVKQGRYEDRQSRVFVDAAAVCLYVNRGANPVQYMEMWPFASGSDLHELIEHLYGADIEGVPYPFAGGVPGEWTRP